MSLTETFPDLTFGNHSCLLHDTVEQQISVLVPFLQAGIRNNERCVCVLDPEKSRLLRLALAEARVDIEALEQRGALLISSARDFLEHGRFHAAKMIQFLQQAIDESLQLEFNGLRATGDMTWQAGSSEYDGFIEYEATLDQFFEGKPLIGLCQYNRNAFQPHVLQNVFRTHRSVVIGNQFCPKNLFYQPPDVLMPKDQAIVEAKKAEWMRLQVQRLATAEAERDAADRRKDEFLLSLSHELRTPLTPVLGWTRLIRASEFDKPTVIRGMEVIERNVVAEIALVEDLLDLSRIVAGDLKLTLEPFSVKEAVDSAVAVVELDAIAKRITITRALDGSLSRLYADRNRVQQVLCNLLKNAVKFTPPGGAIQVVSSVDGAFAKIVVSDSGEGIDARQLPRIFDRFSVQDGSTTRRHGGLGIGLSIVKRIVELHRGRIEAHSEGLGRGASFSVWLPTECR
ncbi:MAG TPA: MEDS domain-containing protein [Planctomycetota bacterium]|nr:MEDS domain-containing protein [Planctomycetota bacterium]